MTSIRPPAVAGLFYPSDSAELQGMVLQLLRAAPQPESSVPKAIIAPHAGYLYSGAIAARAYACLAPARERITRVVLLGPSHRVPLLGLATSGADFFHTPLGDIPLDRVNIDSVERLPQVKRLDAAHQMEHSLEVHLPFLQELLGSFRLVPLVVGDATPEETAEVIEHLWGGDETALVISSDLSHFHDYATAQRLDCSTRDAIEQLNCSAIGHEDACGRNPIRGLLVAAKRRGLIVETLDLRNSADAAGPCDSVVGYGAWSFTDVES
ncbi:AmmeMemoRadiSam system protein B [Thiohalomonas denitrificans]|uniref:AmmeMemoRadiSam system protein B n=1 Tax=Thiohalomonas denitrificans TaxID=415747 RepID=UPI0026EC0269|nr:AmmeMemoRadiSam system protein B [Thiohalomonas denitrificans]